jgi:glycosyltransferase involved in cell wall biosynthesis
MPRVTVIMATYNWSTVLPYSIGSVLDQTFTDWELLVVGDGCTDDSGRVVAAVGDARVRWIDLQPGTHHQYGPSNEGLRQAAGAIVAYLGHDDLWLPGYLERAVAAIDAGADLAYSIGLPVDTAGGFKAPLIETRAGWIAPSCVVHRKAVTDAIGGWRDFRTLTISPEHDLWLRIRSAGYRMTLIPRLGVVKFPASERRDVYRQRPCHEQAAWLARIRAQPDFEAIELGGLVVGLNRLASAAHFGRRLWRLVTAPSQWLAFVRRRGGARITARQRYKGATRARADEGGIHVGRGAQGSAGGHERLADDSGGN